MEFNNSPLINKLKTFKTKTSRLKFLHNYIDALKQKLIEFETFGDKQD